jgi:hypothetical protein
VNWGQVSGTGADGLSRDPICGLCEAPSRHEPVEAPEVVLDWKHVDSCEPGFGRVGANGVGTDHRAGAGRVRVHHPDGEAVEDAPAVVEAPDFVPRRAEALGHALVGDQDASAFGDDVAAAVGQLCQLASFSCQTSRRLRPNRDGSRSTSNRGR